MALNKIALDIDINSNIISLSVVDFLKPKIQDIMEIEIAKQYVAIKDAKPTVTLLAAYVIGGTLERLQRKRKRNGTESPMF